MILRPHTLLMAALLLPLAAFSADPILIATADAFSIRSRGIASLGLNPANLGYYGMPFMPGMTGREQAKYHELTDWNPDPALDEAPQAYYYIQLIASQNVDLVHNTRSEFSQKVRNVPTVIMVVDSTFKLRAGGSPNRSKIETLLNAAIAAGYTDAWIATTEYPLYQNPPRPRFTITMLGMSATVRNNAIYPAWINEQLFGGLDLRDSHAKADFLSVFPSGLWQLGFRTQASGLSFTTGNLGLSMLRPEFMASINMPGELLDVAFNGVKFNNPREISDLTAHALAAAPVSVAVGKQLVMPRMGKYIDRLFLGGGVNVLWGLADVHITADNLLISTQADSIHLTGRTKVVSNMMDQSGIAVVRGMGLSFDLGMAVEINRRLSMGLSLNNVLGSIGWSGRTVTEREFDLRLSALDIEEIVQLTDAEQDSVWAGFAVLDTTYTDARGRTIYPGKITLGVAYQLQPDITLDAAIIKYFENSYYDHGPPQLSLSVEYSRFARTPLYFGIGVGGLEGFKWGLGGSISAGMNRFSFGFGQSRGLFNSARGVSLAAEWRIVI